MNKLQLLHENKERDKFVCLFNWLDTQLEITEDKSNCIDKTRLEKQIIFNYFEFFDSEIFNSKNIDFVKKGFKSLCYVFNKRTRLSLSISVYQI